MRLWYMQKGLYPYTPTKKNKAFYHWFSDTEDLPSAYSPNHYLLFPHKLLSSTLSKILNIFIWLSCW